MSKLFIPGSYCFKRYDVIVDGRLLVVTKQPFQYLVELCMAARDNDGRWLDNDLSFAARKRQDGTYVDGYDQRARGFVQVLRETLGDVIVAGGARYGLHESLGIPEICPAILNNVKLDVDVYKKLKKYFERENDGRATA